MRRKKIVLAIALFLVVLVTFGIVLLTKDDARNYEMLAIEQKGFYTTGKDLLDKNLQKNYDLLLENAYRLQPTFKTKDISSKEVKKLIYYFRDDNPQIFWLNNNYGYEHNLMTQDINVVSFQYYYTDRQTGEDVIYTNELVEAMNAEVEQAAQNILNGINPLASTYERVKYVHDYLAKNVTYDETATFQHNIYGSLVEKQAVCDGLSYGLMYLLSQMGIESRLAYGVSTEGVAHAWNVVNIDGAYYHVDTTWDMPPEGSSSVIYSNFNVTDDKIHGDRQLFSPFIGDDVGKYFYYIPVPHCTATEYNYFRYEDLYMETYDDAGLKHLLDQLEQAVADQKAEVQMQFASPEDLQSFVTDVTNGTNRKFYRFPYSNATRETKLSTIEKENIVLIQFQYQPE